MKAVVTKLTPYELLQKACGVTVGKDSHIAPRKIYRARHSPARTQLFWIEMEGIPSFVSVHLVRHKIGVEHYVRSNRIDRGGDLTAGRWTPVNHAMLVNAEALMTMSNKRLCACADPKTVEVWSTVVKEVSKVDPELAPYLVPECEARGSKCYELNCCGRCPRVMD